MFIIEQKITKTQFKPKKAGFNGHHFFLIIDESGSMARQRLDTIGGVNTFIQEQAKAHGNSAKITIVTFEGGTVKVPIDGLPATEINDFKEYTPRGGTNLLDAIGDTFTRINALLDKSKKKDRPSVYVQIVTDGEENMSTRYIKEEIQSMVSEVEKSDWLVSYVGANVDAFSEAGSLGISKMATSGYSTTFMDQTWKVVSSNMGKMSSMRGAQMSASEIYASGDLYTKEEKDSIN